MLGSSISAVNKIGIYTYKPALDKFKNDPSSRFELDYPMAPPLTVLGITRTGAANDVKKETESPAGDDQEAAPEE